MGSLGTGEILVIVLVALIVFGPERLPEITRKAGELLAQARQMSRSVTDSIDGEYKEVVAPIKDLKAEYDSTMSDFKSVASSVTDLGVDLPTVDLGTLMESDGPADSGEKDQAREDEIADGGTTEQSPDHEAP